MREPTGTTVSAGTLNFTGGTTTGPNVTALTVAAGGTSIEDPPGERNGPFGTLNLAYLRDPSGNKGCAVHRVG